MSLVTEDQVLDQLGHGEVLLVADNASDAKTSFVAKDLGATLVHIDVLSGSHLASDPHIVFDVDLRRIDAVRTLKSALRKRGRGIRLFLVDAGNRVTSVHAHVLGADLTLPRPASAADIGMALRRHCSAGPTPINDEQVMQSIDAGVEALDGSFRGLMDGSQFAAQTVIDASGRIADAVSGLGVESWLAAVKGHHIGTFQHCMLVTGVAAAFGSKTGMARRDVVTLAVAGLLHDIGKAAVPVDLLDKPSALTAPEMAILRRHPMNGYDYLVARSDVKPEVLTSVRSHHEYLDGTGYPDGLSGSEIDDITRIITISDVYAALIERRSYKEPKPPAQAMAILDEMAAAGKLETSLVREMGRIMLPKSR